MTGPIPKTAYPLWVRLFQWMGLEGDMITCAGIMSMLAVAGLLVAVFLVLVGYEIGKK